MSRERNLFIKSGRLGKRNKYIYRLVSLLSLSLSAKRALRGRETSSFFSRRRESPRVTKRVLHTVGLERGPERNKTFPAPRRCASLRILRSANEGNIVEPSNSFSREGGISRSKTVE